MDFLELKKKYKKDNDLPDRAFELEMYRRVLEGTVYDVLRHPFYRNYSTQNLGSDRSTIPLCDRRPSVRSALCKVVVDSSLSLLFGEGRFPYIQSDDENTQKHLSDIISDENCDIPGCMIDAAFKGSIGSVAILMKIIEGRIFLECMFTEYLTPEFLPSNPNELAKITQKCKKSGKELIEMGYTGLESEEIYWFMRYWDNVSETYYVPWKITEKEDFSPQIDQQETVIHNLGFVPAVWIKNLPGSDNKIDGLCTFKYGIDTNIEADYQLSQAGRGLKYSSEPLLMIKNPGLSMQGEIAVGDGNVIEVEEGGDVKHVEIDGQASDAVINFYRVLREIVLENIHGNRANPDKLNTVQSGKGMEMLYLPLVWMAANLRLSYGKGLVKLIKMIIAVNTQLELIIGEEPLPKGAMNSKSKITLKWRDWFESTKDDRMKEATTVKTLKESGLLSTQTAVSSLSDEYDIPDVEEELAKIQKEQQETQVQEVKLNSTKNNNPRTV